MTAPVALQARRPRTPRGRALAVRDGLRVEYPQIVVPLDHGSPFQLLAAIILSAQCTDARVNQVTPGLFAYAPDARSMAAADPAEIERLIYPTGFFRAKTRSLIGMAQAIADRFGGEVPGRMDDLVTLPGVGRKTANVILGHGFGTPGIAVDTHVLRLSRRLGLTEATDPVRVERDLAALWPRRDWSETSMRLIYHGRRVCTARSPHCGDCIFAGWCPSRTPPGPSRRSGA
jgi:endonuclease-3